MQLFQNTNYDFVRWRWHAIALSLVVILAGAVTIWNRGLPLGVDFAGGTIVIVKFQQATPVERVRAVVSAMPERGRQRRRRAGLRRPVPAHGAGARGADRGAEHGQAQSGSGRRRGGAQAGESRGRSRSSAPRSSGPSSASSSSGRASWRPSSRWPASWPTSPCDSRSASRSAPSRRRCTTCS